MTDNMANQASVQSIEDAMKILVDDLDRDPDGYTETDLDGKPTGEQLDEIRQVIRDGLSLVPEIVYLYNPDKGVWQIGVVKTTHAVI